MMFVTAQHLSVLLLRFLVHELILRRAHDLKWSSCFERVQSDLLSRSPVGLTSAVSILISGENVSRLHTQSPPPPRLLWNSDFCSNRLNMKLVSDIRPPDPTKPGWWPHQDGADLMDAGTLSAAAWFHGWKKQVNSFPTSSSDVERRAFLVVILLTFNLSI